MEEKFITSDTPMKYRCHRGHIFETTLDNINRNCWCKYCKSNFYMENTCRLLLSTMLGERFLKGKFFEWLRNDRKSKMESDGYCKKLNIAFEYHGQQHFEIVPLFHNTIEDLEQRQKDDQCKRDKYAEHGVNYIEITFYHAGSSYLELKVKIKRIRERILQECDRLGIEVPYPDIEIDEGLIFCDNDKLEKLQGMVKDIGGVLVSDKYFGAGNQKYNVICSRSHESSQTYINIRNGNLKCNECKEIEKKEVVYKQGIDLAEDNDGSCLNVLSYNKYESEYIFICFEGHTFKSTKKSANKRRYKEGNWCPICLGYCESESYEQIVARI